MANQRIALLGVPMDLGAHLRGVDMGPSAIRIAGLVPRLNSLGWQVNDLGNLSVPHAVVAGKGAQMAQYSKPILEPYGAPLQTRPPAQQAGRSQRLSPKSAGCLVV